MLNRTTSLIVLGAVLVAGAPLATADTAQPPAKEAGANPAVIDTATAMRCSAAFGIVANEQKRGLASALKYPPLDKRGREFFVQTGARLMDQEKLTREAMQQRFKQEVEKLQNESIASPDPEAFVRSVMDPCIKLLDLTVPAA